MVVALHLAGKKFKGRNWGGEWEVEERIFHHGGSGGGQHSVSYRVCHSSGKCRASMARALLRFEAC